MFAPRVLLDVPPTSPVWGVPLPAPLASNNTVVEKLRTQINLILYQKAVTLLGGLKILDPAKYLDPANLEGSRPLQKTVERSDGMLRPPNTTPLGRVPGTRMCRTKVHGRTTT